MAIPIFSHQANPAVDRPLLRKKRAYVEELVESGRAHYLDADNKFLGVVLRARVLDSAKDSIERPAGSGFDSAWHIMQSGWAGPLVWQLRTQGAANV